MEQKYQNKNIIIKELFIKMLLKKGKKNLAEKIYNNILIELRKKTKQKPIFILIKIINILSPGVKLINVPISKRKIKRRKNRYYLMFLNLENSYKIVINWILFYSRKRKTNFLKNVINEIYNILDNKGKSINKRNEIGIELNKLRHSIKFTKKMTY
jgi:ribosomal protein S7